MSSLAVGAIAFACVFTCAMFAMIAKQLLPDHHLASDSKDVMKLGMGLIATLTAMVLGLLIATAKGQYDTQGSAVKDISANLILLDRMLGKYGPETKEARGYLRNVTESMLMQFWPEDNRAGDLTPGESRAAGDNLFDAVAELKPKTEAQQTLKARCVALITELAQARFRLYARHDGTLPLPFLVVLIFWLSILFGGYGLLAPPNATIVTVLLVCALSVSGAILLMLELATPFEGILRLSSSPFRDALAILGK